MTITLIGLPRHSKP